MSNLTLIRSLRTALGPENVLSAPSELLVYDCDAFTADRQLPAAVVFPRSTEQVADVMRICGQHQCPVVPRGAGTGLAGGCTPVASGVVLMLTRMKRILEICVRDRLASVEPGVVSTQLERALEGTDLYFAPDPSSQGTATIGGNVATNAGGPRTLKYGTTANHIAGLEVVLGDGAIIELGPVEDPAEINLADIVCGSEGTLAVVTKIWVRLTRKAQGLRTLRAAFTSINDAIGVANGILANGIVPATMEVMDRGILESVESAFALGVPRDAAALLLIDLEGRDGGLDAVAAQVADICKTHNATEICHAGTQAERSVLWKCRNVILGAVARLSMGYRIQDGVVPRTRLPHILQRIVEIGAKHGVRIVKMAHASDGTVYSILLCDERDRDLMARVHAAGREVLEECVACGGSITAEHGIGIEKIGLMERMFKPSDLQAMQHVRQAFDPAGRLNPGKKFRAPTLPNNDEVLPLQGSPQ